MPSSFAQGLRPRCRRLGIVRRTVPVWLVAIVGASFVVRTALAWLRATPALFPDEYIYASIGRSLASSGRPQIRGASAHFPALLEPILTAPAWLIGDVGIAFRVVQGIGALAMSLAAVPVYILARRLDVSHRLALGVAALAVLVPDLLYASFVTSEPFAYPLVLAAVAAGTVALAKPTRRAQLAFVAFAGLACLARAQLAVLPIVFFLAALVLGLRERRVRSALREQFLPLGIFLLPLLALPAAGPSHVLGYYRSVLHLHLHPIATLRWVGWDAMVLAYASGWIIVPGALLGLWLALRRPASRVERAFAVVVVLLAAALLAEAGLLQGNAAGQAAVYGANAIKERYVFYLVPLLGLCFALYAKRGWPARLPHLALAAGLLVLSVRVPLSGFAVASTLSSSPILFAVFWLRLKLGSAGNAASLVAAAVGLLSVVAVLASRRPRLGTPLALGLALVATSAASAGAVALDVQSTTKLRRATLPADPSWVDEAHVGPVTLLQSFSGGRGFSLQELFWNRSITRVALLPGASPFDSFRTEQVHVAADGSLSIDGRALGGPLLVDTSGSTVRLQGARLIRTAPTAALWIPDASGRPRLSLYALGRYADGWLANSGLIVVWPDAPARTVSGWLSMQLTAAPEIGAATLTFRHGAQTLASLRLRPGASQRLRIPMCATGEARISYRSNVLAIIGGQPASVKASAPVFTPSASACPDALRTEVAVSQRDLIAERVGARGVLDRVDVDRHRH